MNAIAEERNRTALFTYAKALSFLLPPIGVFAVATVFVLPKIKQMCADVGYDPRAIFGPMDFVIDQKWVLLVLMAMLFCAMEQWLPFWRRHRASFVALFVFVVNSAVLTQLVCALFVAALVGPAMHR
jgi:hypothetical protein